MRTQMFWSVRLLLALSQAVAFLHLASTSSGKVFTQEEVSDLEKFAGDVMGCANIPGLALGVVRGGAAFSTGLGVADMTTGHPVDKRTLFNLGSTAKLLVPYVMAQILLERKDLEPRISWNTRLEEVLRLGQNVTLPPSWAHVTLRDALVHKSGQSAADLSTMVGLTPEVDREELLRRLQFLPETTHFQNSNHYSNIMYTIVGHLAERLTGINWAELVKVKVLDKLRMTSSSCASSGVTSEDVAVPYRFQVKKARESFVEQNKSIFSLNPFDPVGSIWTSAEDMTSLMPELLRSLQQKGNESGITGLVADAFHSWVVFPGNQSDRNLAQDTDVSIGYGMGWYSSLYRGQRLYIYNGSLYAFSSQIWLLPNTQSAIFVAMNGPGNEQSQQALEGILYHVSDLLLRQESWLRPLNACHSTDDLDYLDPPGGGATAEELALVKYLVPVEKYIGIFGHGFLGDISLQPNPAGVLTLKLGRNLQGELLPDLTESKLRLQVTSALHNTAEWAQEKVVEFLMSTAVHLDSDKSSYYDKIRIYMGDHSFYEFHRGKLFETLLETTDQLLEWQGHQEEEEAGQEDGVKAHPDKENLGLSLTDTADHPEDQENDINSNHMLTDDSVVSKEEEEHTDRPYIHNQPHSHIDPRNHSSQPPDAQADEPDRYHEDQEGESHNENSPESKNSSLQQAQTATLTLVILTISSVLKTT